MKDKMLRLTTVCFVAFFFQGCAKDRTADELIDIVKSHLPEAKVEHTNDNAVLFRVSDYRGSMRNIGVGGGEGAMMIPQLRINTAVRINSDAKLIAVTHATQSQLEADPVLQAVKDRLGEPTSITEPNDTHNFSMASFHW